MINKNKNMKAKAFGGLGIAVFLCLLMALMPYSGVVENNEIEENIFRRRNTTRRE